VTSGLSAGLGRIFRLLGIVRLRTISYRGNQPLVLWGLKFRESTLPGSESLPILNSEAPPEKNVTEGPLDRS